MSLDPFVSAPIEIQIHAAAAVVAVALGPVALYRKRRDTIHKTVGYVWVVAMLTVAVSAFFIHSFAIIGPFSPLHGFALLTFWSLWRAIASVRRGDIRMHRLTMQSLYWYGLLLAGLANFLPGRLTNEALFAGRDHLGFGVIAFGVLVIVGRTLADKRRKGAMAISKSAVSA